MHCLRGVWHVSHRGTHVDEAPHNSSLPSSTAYRTFPWLQLHSLIRNMISPIPRSPNPRNSAPTRPLHPSLPAHAAPLTARTRRRLPRARRHRPGPDAEAHFKELEALEVAVEGARLQRTVERAQAHLEHTRARFAAGLQRLALGKKIKVRAGVWRVRVCGGQKGRNGRGEEGARVGGGAGGAGGVPGMWGSLTDYQGRHRKAPPPRLTRATTPALLPPAPTSATTRLLYRCTAAISILSQS